MKKIFMIGLTLALLLGAVAGAASAYGADRGTIRGAVYQDVNGDGKCVNTGVAGENPVSGVSLEFVSGDGNYTIHLYTGENGTYGLADAGFSNWRVTATPSSEWVVTSQNPQFAYINFDKTEALGVNFCVAKVGYWSGPITPVFPIQPIYPGGTTAAVCGAAGVGCAGCESNGLVNGRYRLSWSYSVKHWPGPGSKTPPFLNDCCVACGDCQPLIGSSPRAAHGFNKTLPIFLRSSIYWCAAAASLNGNTLSTVGRNKASSYQATICAIQGRIIWA